MHTNLSEIQKQKYFSLCGESYQSKALKGRFSTSKPYNNEYYKFSPWHFRYVFDSETGYLICELFHEIANSRLYAWDHNGDELSSEILSEYFKNNPFVFDKMNSNKRMS